MILLFTISKVFSRLACAPPAGSRTISSINFNFFMSVAVNFKASAACSLYSQLRHKIEEQDSGDITEYHLFSNINTLSPTPITRAPQQAPPPIIITVSFFLRDVVFCSLVYAFYVLSSYFFSVFNKK